MRIEGGFMQRVELACHTGYSRMNGIGFAEDWLKFAKKNGISTLVITDKGNVDSYPDFQRQTMWKYEGIKYIMGADLCITDDRNIDGNAATSGRLSVLIRNEKGRKNLYRILSEGEMKYKNGAGEPQIPLSILLENRDGLLIGSGSEEGLLIGAEDYDKRNYDFLDYIELPTTNISSADFDSLLELADYHKLPAVAVDAPHYMTEDEDDAYRILTDQDECDGKWYHGAEMLLKHFEYLGKEKAYEIVVTNSNLIADMCEEVPAFEERSAYPTIENQDDILRDICEKALPLKYKNITPEIRQRLEWELEAIKYSDSAFMFIQIKDVFDRLGLLPFQVGSRGLVGSSMVAYLCNISEIEPINAKLSPYFFFGMRGDKGPDIDLNFAESIQHKVRKALETCPGVGSVIKAGTIGTISESYADNLIHKYCEEHHRYFFDADRNRIVNTLTKCVRTRGQHPGGVIMLPIGMDLSDICPVTTVGYGEDVVCTSAYDYHSIDNIVYKFDALGHTSPDIITRLYDLTGADPRDISLEDAEVMEMFKCSGDTLPRCAGVSEFSTEYALNALKIAKPQSFEELVKVSAIIHGTDTWLGNAEVLISNGIASISEVLASRDDIYDALIKHGIDEQTAFSITENVRKGKVHKGKTEKWPEWKENILAHGVPEWFASSCEKIGYMFPRAHAYSYVMSAWRMAWYKLHFPLEFYLVMLEVPRKNGFDVSYMAYGKDKLESFAEFLGSDYCAETALTRDVRHSCMLLHDYYDHGFTFRVSKEKFDGAETFRIIDDHTIEVDEAKCIRS